MVSRVPWHTSHEREGQRVDGLTRRTVLRLGVPGAFAIAGVRPAVAEPIDGKGNDVCPCFIDITGATLSGDETIEVSGPCAVANPPEEVTVHVRVRGSTGARAVGAATFDCTAREDGDTETTRDTFSVSAPVRGKSRFGTDKDVTIHATAHIRPDREAHIVFRWSWEGVLE